MMPTGLSTVSLPSQEQLKPAANHSLATAFLRVGRLGLWAQIAIGLISIAMAVSAFVLDSTMGVGTRGSFVLIQYLTIASLLVLGFTTIWFYRYTLIAGQIPDSARCPPASTMRRIVWVGVVASSIGLVLSMLIMLFEVIQLFLYFLRVPQAGIPVVQTTGGPATWVSAGDILSLAVVIFTAFVEVLVLALGLWLLFRTTAASAEFPQPYDDG
jgi:hypothetical protein